MLIRYRWYRIKFPHKDFDLSSRIASRPLSREASFGFSSIEDELGALKFRFLWRTPITVTRLDENGTPAYEVIDSVSIKDFAIVNSGGSTFLRVENPGRSLRELLNALETLVGFGFTSDPVTFENTKPTTVFETVESTRLVGLKVVGAVIQEDLVARMEFASKQGMIVEKMRLLEGLRYNVDSAVFELMHQGVRGQLAFSSNGVLKISGLLAPKLLELIERDLPALV